MVRKLAVNYQSLRPKIDTKMAFQLTWTIEGEQQLVRRLRGVSDQLKDWKPAFRQATNKLKSIFSNDVFATQGRVIGETWPPLKAEYLAQKRKRGFGAGPLVATGKMQRSFQTLVKIDMGAVWNSVFYFKYHQSNKPRFKIPRRVMMKLGSQQKEIVIKIFHLHWFKKLRM